MYSIINPLARLGMPFTLAPNSAKGMTFTNLSGATISKGKIAALDVTNTTNKLQALVPVTASTSKYPLVVALADVAASANSSAFMMLGQTQAIVTGSTTPGAALTVDATTNATGGTTLITFTNASGGQPSVAIEIDAGDGTNPTEVLFDGLSHCFTRGYSG